MTVPQRRHWLAPLLLLSVGCDSASTSPGASGSVGSPADIAGLDASATGSTDVGVTDAELAGDGSGTDDIAQESCPGASPTAPTEEEVTRESNAGKTLVEVLFVSLLGEGAPDRLAFKITMTNHTCSIPGYDNDLTGMASLETSDGAKVSDATFEALAKDSHHPVGMLTFPRVADGASLIGCDTAWVRLTLTGVDGDPRSFEWEAEALRPVASP